MVLTATMHFITKTVGSHLKIDNVSVVPTIDILFNRKWQPKFPREDAVSGHEEA